MKLKYRFSGAIYLRINQVKFVEDSLRKIKEIWSVYGASAGKVKNSAFFVNWEIKCNFRFGGRAQSAPQWETREAKLSEHLQYLA